MTRGEILKMAKEAENYADSVTPDTDMDYWELVMYQRFAHLVAAAEREAILDHFDQVADSDRICGCCDSVIWNEITEIRSRK